MSAQWVLMEVCRLVATVLLGLLTLAGLFWGMVALATLAQEWGTR